MTRERLIELEKRINCYSAGITSTSHISVDYRELLELIALARKGLELEEDYRALETGRRWEKNSALEEWFPLTAQQLSTLTLEVAQLRAWKAEEQQALIKMATTLAMASCKGDGVVDGVESLAKEVAQLREDKEMLDIILRGANGNIGVAVVNSVKGRATWLFTREAVTEELAAIKAAMKGKQ